MTRIAILDDYQKIAMQSADWESLPADCSVDVFHDIPMTSWSSCGSGRRFPAR